MLYANTQVASGFLKSRGEAIVQRDNKDGKARYRAGAEKWIQPNPVNYLSVFHRIFGKGSIQSRQSILIQKKDLQGVTPLANNTAESLLVSLLLNTKTNESGNNGSFLEIFPDIRRTVFNKRNGIKWKKSLWIVRVRKPSEPISYEFIEANRPITPIDF